MKENIFSGIEVLEDRHLLSHGIEDPGLKTLAEVVVTTTINYFVNTNDGGVCSFKEPQIVSDLCKWSMNAFGSLTINAGVAAVETWVIMNVIHETVGNQHPIEFTAIVGVSKYLVSEYLPQYDFKGVGYVGALGVGYAIGKYLHKRW